MIRKTLLNISVSIFLFSCGNTGSNTVKEIPGTVAARNYPADSSSTIEEKISSDTVNAQTYKGLLYPGKEFRFRDCDGKFHTIEEKGTELSGASNKLLGNLSYSNESIAIEFRGAHKKTKNHITLYNIVDIKPKSFLTPCFNFEFILLGTEPFWSVEIIPNENIITLKDVSTEKSYVFPYSKPEIKSDEYSYHTRNKNGDVLNITVRKENCNDGMSDRNYFYSSEITINGRAMTGCAVKKGDKL